MTKKKISLKDKIKKAIARLIASGFQVEEVEGLVKMKMEQDVLTKDKDVRIITYLSGDNGLLIDGEEYGLEIMLYRKKDDVNKTVNQTGMELTDYAKLEIEEIIELM